MYQNDALTALVKRYMTQSGEQAKRTLEDILALPNAPRRLFGMAFGDSQRAVLKTLADIARKKVGKEALTPLVVRDVDKLIGIADDKARKSAYKLVGICAPDACAVKLAQALKNEKTHYVRPSVILALGNTRSPERYLKNYVIEPGEPKHMEAERDALKKALAKVTAPSVKKPAAFKLPEWCTLTSINQSALVAELKAKGVSFRPSRIRGAVEAPTAQCKTLRCYERAMFRIAEMGAYHKAAQTLNDMGCKGQFYRIEAGSLRPEKRRDAIQAVSAGLAPFGYTDNPSAYTLELRLLAGQIYAIFADTRFAYRKQSVAASINPVTAASIMRLCEPYMRENASVLDPFCGSGTMLIERAHLKPSATLVGVDISGHAIKAACANRRASGIRMALIHGDILGYGAARYDEIIANMPFGIRVLAHASNIKLYAAFADKLLTLLNDDGYAFLLTQEKKLLREEAGKRPALRIIHEENFESGGLCPTLFIIKKEQENE